MTDIFYTVSGINVYRLWVFCCRLFFILLLFIFLSSCAATKKSLSAIGLGGIVGVSNSIKTISIEAVSDSNMNSPVAVDILFIYDAKIYDMFSKLNGPQWFKEKQGLSNLYSNKITIVSVEIVPLSYIEKVTLPKNHKSATNILMFADYRAVNGQYIAELSYFKQLTIRLLKDSYQLTEQGQ
ncbi:MAG: hypothetical protein KTR20_03995 [Cellvibrionaceae bacterium]|nr:hypothetical protein [Cellvibrionaceae bacterium]